MLYIYKYEGKLYSEYSLLGLYPKGTQIIEISSFPILESLSYQISETKNNIKFELIKNLLDLKNDKIFRTNGIFKTLVFNKDTQKTSGDILTSTEFSDIRNYEESSKGLYIFISKILECNPNVLNFVNNNMGKRHLKVCTYDESFLNLYNMIIFNLLEYEKLINSNNTTYIDVNISKKSFKLEEAPKLHEVLGLAKPIVSMLSELKMEYLTESIKDLSEVLDTNSIMILLKLFKNSKILLSKSSKFYNNNLLIKFIGDVKFLCSKKYKITDLLNYLLKQSMNYGKEDFFQFPFVECSYLVDYVNMCNLYGLKFEKYPSQIKKTHDLIANNISALQKSSTELDKMFLDAVNDYKEVEKTISVSSKDDKGVSYKKEYIFIVPKNIKMLVQEGNDLHHCVGSYANNIINKTAHIVFMREADKPNESLVTVDIDKNYKLLEAKKAFNEDIDDIQQKALKNWLKTL